MKAQLKRKELAPLMVEMKALTGLKLKQALSFGRDIRELQKEVDTLADFELTKPQQLIDLQKEFDTLAQAAQGKKGVNEQTILADWHQAPEFIEHLNQYRRSEREFLNAEIAITFKTTFAEKDLKLENVSAQAGWMLSYFTK